VTKVLGVIVAVAALCLVSWAQIPGENPPPAPKYSRLELFGGYAYGRTDLFNSGLTAPLQGWDASLGLNAASWLGFVAEASGLYGTSKIPLAVPAPFPTCPPLCPQGTDTFNVNTKNYNYLFGAQFPYRRSERVTPFGEVLFGHSGVRGEARSEDGTMFAQASGGLGLAGGGGVDFNVSKRFALRFKADYLQTRTRFPAIGRAKQDNVKFTVGIVIRKVHRKKRTLEEETPPEP